MHLTTAYIKDFMCTQLMVLAPGVGFEPTWPKGPQALKQSSPGLSPATSRSAPYLAPRITVIHYALGDPGTTNHEISISNVLSLFGKKRL